MIRHRIIVILLVISGLATPAFATSVPLIVQISPAANIAGIAAALGGTIVDSIPDARTYLLNVPVVPPPLTAPLLGIQSIEPNTAVTLPKFARPAVLTVPGTAAADWYRHQPSMLLIRAGNALPYSTGRGIIVADINSQVDYGHPALVGHLIGGYDFVDSRPAGWAALNQSDPAFLDQSDTAFLDQSDTAFLDQSDTAFLDASLLPLESINPAYSHGTLCAGVIAVIAPDSMIMPLRAFDQGGHGDVFMIAKAIRYAAQHGAQVINMSFGTSSPSQTLRSAVDYARSFNVLLVASAGNDNTSQPQYPAAFNGVMTAAATDLRDVKGSFSNYGSYVFVDAPGVNVISAYPGGFYGIVSGTSFSAPAVSGTAALVRSLRATGVAGSIANGAINVDSKNPNHAGQLGYGRIDVLQAVD
jgi:subtilisin family serine protease